MDGVDEFPAAGVGDPEDAARPEGGSKTPRHGSLRREMRKNVETHYVIKRRRRERQRLRPGSVQDHLLRQLALRSEAHERRREIERHHAARWSGQGGQHFG